MDAGAVTKLTELVASFGEHLRELVRTWGARLGELVDAGPVAVWGAGSKGVSFLNLVAGGRDVSYVVDVNPNKAGLYIPGTGQIVVAPDELEGRELATVLVMNPLYVDEIRRTAGRPRQPGRGDRRLRTSAALAAHGRRGRPWSTGGSSATRRARRASSQAALSTSPSTGPTTRRCPGSPPQAAPATSPSRRATTTVSPARGASGSCGSTGCRGRSSAALASGSRSVPRANSIGRPPRPSVRTPPRSTSAIGSHRRPGEPARS